MTKIINIQKAIILYLKDKATSLSDEARKSWPNFEISRLDFSGCFARDFQLLKSALVAGKEENITSELCLKNVKSTRRNLSGKLALGQARIFETCKKCIVSSLPT